MTVHNFAFNINSTCAVDSVLFCFLHKVYLKSKVTVNRYVTIKTKQKTPLIIVAECYVPQAPGRKIYPHIY